MCQHAAEWKTGRHTAYGKSSASAADSRNRNLAPDNVRSLYRSDITFNFSKNFRQFIFPEFMSASTFLSGMYWNGVESNAMSWCNGTYLRGLEAVKLEKKVEKLNE